MITVAIANAKGGVGKTSLSIHLAVGVATQGYRALLMDLDPQGNATSWLLGDLPGETKGSADALLQGSFDKDTMHRVASTDNLMITPSTPNLTTVDLKLAAEIGGETTLKRALKPLEKRVDVVVLDCPPNLGLTVLSALCAANAVVVPVVPAYLSLKGLQRLEDTIARINERLHVDTSILGYLLFPADPREAITDESRAVLKQEKGPLLYRSEVRVSTAAKALPARKETAWDGADPRGQTDYNAVVSETLSRLNTLKQNRKTKRRRP